MPLQVQDWWAWDTSLNQYYHHSYDWDDLANPLIGVLVRYPDSANQLQGQIFMGESLYWFIPSLFEVGVGTPSSGLAIPKVGSGPLDEATGRQLGAKIQAVLAGMNLG